MEYQLLLFNINQFKTYCNMLIYLNYFFHNLCSSIFADSSIKTALSQPTPGKQAENSNSNDINDNKLKIESAIAEDWRNIGSDIEAVFKKLGNKFKR